MLVSANHSAAFRCPNLDVINFRHGFLFCPFLPLIAALKNLIIFLVKLVSAIDSFFCRSTRINVFFVVECGIFSAAYAAGTEPRTSTIRLHYGASLLLRLGLVTDHFLRHGVRLSTYFSMPLNRSLLID